MHGVTQFQLISVFILAAESANFLMKGLFEIKTFVCMNVCTVFDIFVHLSLSIFLCISLFLYCFECKYKD